MGAGREPCDFGDRRAQLAEEARTGRLADVVFYAEKNGVREKVPGVAALCAPRVKTAPCQQCQVCGEQRGAAPPPL